MEIANHGFLDTAKPSDAGQLYHLEAVLLKGVYQTGGKNSVGSETDGETFAVVLIGAALSFFLFVARLSPDFKVSSFLNPGSSPTRNN